MKSEKFTTYEFKMKIYGYLRVSTDDQDENSQRRGVDEFAAKKGLKIDEYVIDHGLSGAKEFRVRAIGKLIKKLQKGDTVIASEISRIGRRLVLRAVTDSTSLGGGGGFIIDDYPFDFFGVHILDGTLEKLRQVDKVKERLTVAENSRDGAVYDTGGAVMTASNEISIKCLIRAVNMQTCVNNYYALLNYIKRPKLRRIVVKSTLEILDCYYKSATCENVHLKLASGAAGIAFTIVFTVVGKGLLKIIGNDGANEYLTDEQGVFLAP